MAAQQDFAAMFGGAQHAINYQDTPRTKHDYLPTPDPDDDHLTTITRKLAAISHVIERGASVAVHTGFHDHEATARLIMTPPEAMQYDAWKAGINLPTIN